MEYDELKKELEDLGYNAKSIETRLANWLEANPDKSPKAKLRKQLRKNKRKSNLSKEIGRVKFPPNMNGEIYDRKCMEYRRISCTHR